jgi:hypothetical protein
MTDWTPEEDEAFNEVEKNSNLGKQILRDIEGQPYVYAPKREWVDLTNAEIGEIFRAGWANNMDYAEAIQKALKEKNDRPL